MMANTDQKKAGVDLISQTHELWGKKESHLGPKPEHGRSSAPGLCHWGLRYVAIVIVTQVKRCDISWHTGVLSKQESCPFWSIHSTLAQGHHELGLELGTGSAEIILMKSLLSSLAKEIDVLNQHGKGLIWNVWQASEQGTKEGLWGQVAGIFRETRRKTPLQAQGTACVQTERLSRTWRACGTHTSPYGWHGAEPTGSPVGPLTPVWGW